MLALLIAVALLRIAATWRTFSATADEATHVGAGLELIQFHRYTLHRHNPPLPRLVLATIPWLSGMRFDPRGTFTDQLHSVFYGAGKYESNLARARAGNLFFFLLATAGIWFCAREALDQWGAILAVLLFTTEPMILGHSGLATHDAAAAAGVACSLAVFSRWLRRPKLTIAIGVGAMFGLSVLFKFSCIAFVPVACLALYAVRLVHDRPLRASSRRNLLSVLPALAVSLLVIWAGYGFTMGRRSDIAPWVTGLKGFPALMLAHVGASAPLPAPAFLAGLATMITTEANGWQSYLCGEISMTGWWWYFPFAILLKTTLAALVAFLIGGWFALRSPSRRWMFLEWSAAALSMVAVAMPSTLDIGVRYLLPFYGPFAIATAIGLCAMFEASQRLRRCAALLLVLQLVASAGAHPDYFPYFNALAGRDPSRYLVDSNLDWGQDVLRLRRVIRQRKIDRIGLALLGAADYDALGFPPHYYPNAANGRAEWIAVSDHAYRMAPREEFLWLPSQYERIGRSIRLYRLR